MSIKKLKLITGLIGLTGAIATVFFAFFSVPYVSAQVPESGDARMLGLAVVYIIFLIAFCALALLQLISSVLLMTVKPKTRAFYVVECALSVFDIADFILIVWFAAMLVEIIGGAVLPVITALCVLPVASAVVLKIICAVKFKPEGKGVEVTAENGKENAAASGNEVKND